MKYPEEIVERVIEANDIIDVIGSRVVLTRRGANHMGLCPFHNEKTPSFSVSQSKQIYKCFGCGKGGNVLGFLMDYENMTFKEALSELAERAGIKLPEIEDSNRDRREYRLKENILAVNKEAATCYYRMLRSDKGKHAYEYLTGRGLSAETINRFGLGYAGREGGALYRHLKEMDYSDDILKETGLFAFSEKGVTDKFWDRVMFPIMDQRGKVIAFGGRLMYTSDTAPKYLNSPETKAFVKGRNLYGYNIAKHTKADYILLCEGYMDTIALHQAGFDNAVASLGTALTADQAKLIGRITKKTVITYDQDGAGRKAALRAIPILKDEGIEVRILEMTPYKDPDEFIRNLGADEYLGRINDAKDAFFFEAETMHAGVEQTVASKTRFDHEIARKIAEIEDIFERNNYIDAVSARYGIDKKALKDAVNDYGLKMQDKRLSIETKEKISVQKKRLNDQEDGSVKAEKMLLAMIANNREMFDRSKGLVGEQDFTDEMCIRLYKIIFDLYADGRNIEPAKIVNDFDTAEEQGKVTEILYPGEYSEKYDGREKDAAFADVVIRVLENSNEAKMAQAQADRDPAALMSLVGRKKQIEDVRKKLLSFSRHK